MPTFLCRKFIVFYCRLKACFGILPLPGMNHAQLCSSLARLGNAFMEADNGNLALAKRRASAENHWFDEKSVDFALSAWKELLTEQNLQEWVQKGGLSAFVPEPKNIGIVMAGNVPLVGLHDLLCVLLSGHRARIKLSSDDSALMTFVIQELSRYSPWLEERLILVERLTDIDAIIATGSNNTSRYFEYYFRNIPHLLRKNRNSLAILTGSETEEDLFEIGKDVFTYYGLGCRNITQLLLPEGSSPTPFYDAIADHFEVLNHNKYANNYTYHRALFLLNQQKHLDNNFLLLKEDPTLYSPVGCLNYSYYKDEKDLEAYVRDHEEHIQVIVSKGSYSFHSVMPGQSQKPALDDYADGVNTLQFCVNL